MSKSKPATFNCLFFFALFVTSSLNYEKLCDNDICLAILSSLAMSGNSLLDAKGQKWLSYCVKCFASSFHPPYFLIHHWWVVIVGGPWGGWIFEFGFHFCFLFLWVFTTFDGSYSLVLLGYILLIFLISFLTFYVPALSMVFVVYYWIIFFVIFCFLVGVSLFSSLACLLFRFDL